MLARIIYEPRWMHGHAFLSAPAKPWDNVLEVVKQSMFVSASIVGPMLCILLIPQVSLPPSLADGNGVLAPFLTTIHGLVGHLE